LRADWNISNNTSDGKYFVNTRYGPEIVKPENRPFLCRRNWTIQDVFEVWGDFFSLTERSYVTILSI